MASQIEELRRRILEQLEHVPQEQQEQAQKLKQYIKNMNDEQFVAFLKQQGLLARADKQHGTPAQTSGCIFCAIAQNKARSFKLYEDSEIVAVLDINPISKGHTLVVPKKHITASDELPATIYEKARMLGQLIKKVLQADKVEFLTTSRIHALINIIPIYNMEPSLDLPRQGASEQELEALRNKIVETFAKEHERSAEQEQSSEESYEMPKRRP